MESKKEEIFFNKSLKNSKRTKLYYKNPKENNSEKNIFEVPKDGEYENKNKKKLKGKKTNKMKENDKINKINDYIPIISHTSEKPPTIVEEMSSENNKYDENSINTSNMGKNLKIDNFYKKYTEIPIIAHTSEKPTTVIEEINSGRIYANIKTSLTGYREGNILNNGVIIIKRKCKIKKSKYIEIPIIAHTSEKPCIVFEEMSAGKYCSKITTSVKATSKQNQQSNKSKYLRNKLNTKKYKEIPIIAHCSEKPTLVFEEMNSGKIDSLIPITNYNGRILKKNKQISNQLRSSKKELKIKKYVEIPIISHNSEKPNFIMEEINSGKFYSNIKTSKTTYKENNYQKNNQKSSSEFKNNKKTNEFRSEGENVTTKQESTKTPSSFQQIDARKLCSNLSKEPEK